jgi:ubiquinone/menaquinone biosynthesis C-methylase UbiE
MTIDPDLREIRRRYDRLAGIYDQRWVSYIEASVRETLKRVDLADARDVLDVGCGTGTLLEAASSELPAARLAGVDLSPGMLAVARRKLGPRATLVAANAERLPFRSRSFDMALSASALHFWRDPSAALLEIHRVLRPRGRIAITDWCANGWIDRLRDLVLRRVEPAHFRVYRTANLAAMLTEAGFDDVHVERYRIGRLWGLMTGVATASAAP